VAWLTCKEKPNEKGQIEMETAAFVLTLLVAAEHVYIMLLEMFFSSGRAAQRTFRLSADFLSNPRVKTLFANQGLYNGFLAAGLVWGTLFASEQDGSTIQMFFLSCVIIAAVFGAFTSNMGILFKQGFPAIAALVCVWLTL
jgi:putative membrane protein